MSVCRSVMALRGPGNRVHRSRSICASDTGFLTSTCCTYTSLLKSSTQSSSASLTVRFSTSTAGEVASSPASTVGSSALACSAGTAAQVARRACAGSVGACRIADLRSTLPLLQGRSSIALRSSWHCTHLQLGGRSACPLRPSVHACMRSREQVGKGRGVRKGLLHRYVRCYSCEPVLRGSGLI